MRGMARPTDRSRLYFPSVVPAPLQVGCPKNPRASAGELPKKSHRLIRS